MPAICMIFSCICFGCENALYKTSTSSPWPQGEIWVQVEYVAILIYTSNITGNHIHQLSPDRMVFHRSRQFWAFPTARNPSSCVKHRYELSIANAVSFAEIILCFIKNIRDWWTIYWTHVTNGNTSEMKETSMNKWPVFKKHRGKQSTEAM